MNNNKCRAKNPGACRYHGSRAEITTAQARLAMVQVEHTYREMLSNASYHSQTALYNTYEEVNKARANYYATDEGLGHLENALASDTGDKNYLASLKAKALHQRYENEQNDGGSAWAPATRTVSDHPIYKAPAFPARIEKYFENGVKNIASIRDSDGGTTHYRYSENGQVYVEYQDAAGNYDMDAQRIIGRVKNDNEAFSVAHGWWRKQLGR